MIIKSLDHLQLISKKIADKISEKDCIFLVGEIGVGKTTFTRSLINYFQKREGIKQTELSVFWTQKEQENIVIIRFVVF